jgi:hypothetical protein
VQNDTRPEKKDMYYFQLGGVARGGSGHMDIGLPVQVFSHEFPFRNKGAYFERAAQALQERQGEVTKESLRNASRSERIYRAGDIMNDLVQVSRTEWAVRILENGKHVFYFVQMNPDGTFKSKRLEYKSTDLGFRESLLRTIHQNEAYNETGSSGTRELTEGEKNFGKMVEADLAATKWGQALPQSLIHKFNLASGDPSQFTNAVPLPFQGGASGMQFGGVDGIVDKLGLRATAPGMPGLDGESVTAVKGLIQMMFSKIDTQSVESGIYQGIFINVFDIQMSMRAQELSTAAPARQKVILEEILSKAAREADMRGPGNGGSLVTRALEDAAQSEGW